jgi:aminotransferase
MEALDRMGLTYGHPGGGMYVYTNITSLGMPATRFCETLLREAQVMVFPGTLFGDETDDYIRITLLQSLDNIKEALERMEQFVTKYRRPA